MTLRLALAALALGGFALAGCGHETDLVRPVQSTTADPNLAQSQSAAARARADTSGVDPDAPQSAREVRTYEEAPVAPPRAAPITPSQAADPFTAPPQGSLPDPYSHPERPGA